MPCRPSPLLVASAALLAGERAAHATSSTAPAGERAHEEEPMPPPEAPLPSPPIPATFAPPWQMTAETRNRACPCGNDKKYKKCCGGADAYNAIQAKAQAIHDAQRPVFRVGSPGCVMLPATVKP